MITHIVYRRTGASRKETRAYLIAEALVGDHLAHQLKVLAPCQGFHSLEDARRVENCLNDHYRIKEKDCEVCNWKVRPDDDLTDPYRAPATAPAKEVGLFEREGSEEAQEDGEAGRAAREG